MNRPGHILVVDDNIVSRRLLQLALEEQGYRVSLAEHGKRALTILTQEAIDVVLLDILMPELDGYSILKMIKADENLHHLPVIMITSVEDPISILRCIELGATDYLPKPFNAGILRARVRASLAEKRLRDLELEYLEQVDQVTSAAAAVETATFDPLTLDPVATRPDALGRLARVFQRMAHQVRVREHDLEQQNRFKSAFIGRITHELRSPFVAAGFSVELLRRYAEHGMISDLQEQLVQLDHNLANGRRMINGIIAFASLMSRQVELCLQPTDLATLVHSATAHLQSLADARAIILTYDLSPNLSLLQLDPERMGEAIAHLVHNAIKFNHQNGYVRISCWPYDTHLIFKVEDNGRGIEPDKLPLIWEAFMQEADDERRGVEGMGLGLALVRQVVEAHGGEVVATSQLGSGSTFGFRLPLTQHV